MTLVEIVNLFACYGVDVLVLATITCALTQILKTTVLKKAPKKLYAFLPFGIGALLYSAYSAMGGAPFCWETVKTVAGMGISVGAVATVIYFLFESIVGGRRADFCALVKEMIDGFVGEGDKDKAAERIVAAATPEEIAAIISEYAAEGVNPAEIEALSKLIAETLKDSRMP